MPEFILDRGGRDSAAWFKSLDEFTQGYVEAIFFCGMPTDEHGDDLRDFTLADMSEEMRKRVVDDCNDFVAMINDSDEREMWEHLQEHIDAGRYSTHRAGCDFWFTRNGHGAGFWDRGLGGLGDALTRDAKNFGSCDVYLGDDDKLYIG